MPTALVNGARLNYLQVAPGSAAAEDLVLVHGLATSLAFWYLPYASVFSERYRVTMFDLRGHGRSELTAGGYAPQAQAADLEGLMDHLGIERAHFVAHSFGGVVALGLARRAPARVSSLVLADTQVSATRHMPVGTWAHSRRIQTLLDRHDIDLDVQSPYFGYQLLTRVAEVILRDEDLPEELFELVGPPLARYPRRTAKRWLELIERGQHELLGDDGLTPEVLRSLRFPLVAMYGDRSRACATSELMRTFWPHAEFVTIPNAGHFFPSSRAAEVIAACDEFWDAQLTAAPKVA